MDVEAIIALVLAALGIIGAIVPMVPGPPISWVGLLCLYFSSSISEPYTLTALLLWLLAAAVLTALDFILPVAITRMFGGHKAAQIGATIGLFVGLFFTPVGMVLGSVIGAFVGEFMVTDQDFMTAFKAAVGSFVSFILTTGMKLTFSCLLLFSMIKHLQITLF